MKTSWVILKHLGLATCNEGRSEKLWDNIRMLVDEKSDIFITS